MADQTIIKKEMFWRMRGWMEGWKEEWTDVLMNGYRK